VLGEYHLNGEGGGFDDRSYPVTASAVGVQALSGAGTAGNSQYREAKTKAHQIVQWVVSLLVEGRLSVEPFGPMLGKRSQEKNPAEAGSWMGALKSRIAAC
jgi:hypothetical protein